MEPIKIEITILKPVHKVWEFFTEPDHIKQWNFANERLACTAAQNDLQVGGLFNYTTEAVDKSFSLEVQGVYDEIIPLQTIKYHFTDGRKVEVTFDVLDGNMTKVTQVFEPKPAEPMQMQLEEWYAKLNNFHKHVENN